MAYNSTIISKKRKLDCGCFDYAFSKNMCKIHATIKSTNKRIAAHESQIEDESFKNLVDDLDAIFSRYIRLRYADKDGLVECYTCGIKLPINEIENGHYIHRTDYATRWLIENCKPQCPNCNRNHNDDKEPFTSKLESDNKGITEYLLNLSREVCKPTREELKSLIIEYRFKIKLLNNKP